MKRWQVWIGVLLCSVLWSGSVIAGYNSENDLTLSVNLASEWISHDGSTGEATFAAQEGAHQSVSDSTGQEAAR